MQHLDEGTIHAWLDGALPASEAEQVAKHATECATCAAAVAEARGIIAGSARIVSALDDVPGGVIPGAGRTPQRKGASMWQRLRLTPGRAALAATLLLAVSTTLTLRSSSSPSSVDTTVSVAMPRAAPPAAAPAPPSVTMDSTKPRTPPIVNAAAQRKASVGTPASQTQTVAERRDVADAIAPRDTARRELAKTRAVLQEPAAGASANAPPAASVAAALVRGNVVAAKVSADQRIDSASTFEGCYRLSADSSSGSTQLPPGLPTSFALSRPSAELRPMDSRRELAARRAANLRADSVAAVVMNWQLRSTTQASVTFSASGARPVSLLLTAGSSQGVASSGDLTMKVLVSRASCHP